jgi:PKD repeat protein
VHSYAEGVYDVRLTVSNGAGSDSLVQTGLVTVLPPPPITTFLPSADAKVYSKRSTRNYGREPDLRVRSGSTFWRSFLRFDVAGLDAPVVSAVLRLYVLDASRDGGSFFRVGDGWTEDGITWDNAPPLDGALLGSAGSTALGQWVEIDVTAEVAGDGVYSFGIASSSANSVYYSSREGANPPELVIETVE